MISQKRIVPQNRGEDVNDIMLLPKYVASEPSFGIPNGLGVGIPAFASGPRNIGNATQPVLIAGVAPCFTSPSLNMVVNSKPVYVEDEYGLFPSRYFSTMQRAPPMKPITNAPM